MTARRAVAGLVLLAGAIAIAPLLAPCHPAAQFPDYPYAPPMRLHVRDAGGAWHAPFAYGLRLVDPIERTYEVNRGVRVPLFGTRDRPLFLLGSDALGRDVLSRVLAGTRLSLGLSAVATFVALAIGTLAGASAGYAGGAVDTVLTSIADFVLVLPALYVVLALRGALPLVLSRAEVFWALAVVLGLVGWPPAARGVRGIVRVERGAGYAEAAHAMGAGPWRILLVHLAPAARGFLAVQALLLLPAFVMAEATLSFVGLGFAPPAPSWGAMLQDAGNVRIAADAPWLLAPAGAIVLTVFVTHALTRDELVVTTTK